MDRGEPSNEMSAYSCPHGETCRCQADTRLTECSAATSHSMVFAVLLEDDGLDFVTYVPGLDFASTFGATRDEALERTREMIVGYLDAAAIEGIELDLEDRRREIIELSITR